MVFNMLRKRKLQYATHIECPQCEATTAVDEWNKIVKDVYGPQSPDVRLSATNKSNTFPYQCPECNTGYSAHKLHFVGNKERNEELEAYQVSR
ncbi:hypothetical protein LGQ02_18365 [Bacillus shivajii]|uniref:hypothetical protein n=1 Tax=Bacillus shivajii TaxID=1983719 RepID=UPI001CFBCE13|nr:hypothetical protein [Bacillus shivajii]UCZ52725.1 hypothetical protein LGQ02_18365 [Bacillus shivajii]